MCNTRDVTVLQLELELDDSELERLQPRAGPNTPENIIRLGVIMMLEPRTRTRSKLEVELQVEPSGWGVMFAVYTQARATTYSVVVARLLELPVHCQVPVAVPRTSSWVGQHSVRGCVGSLALVLGVIGHAPDRISLLERVCHD